MDHCAIEGEKQADGEAEDTDKSRGHGDGPRHQRRADPSADCRRRPCRPERGSLVRPTRPRLGAGAGIAPGSKPVSSGYGQGRSPTRTGRETPVPSGGCARPPIDKSTGRRPRLAERREIEERGEVVGTVMPCPRARELTRLPAVGLDLTSDPLARAFEGAPRDGGLACEHAPARRPARCTRSRGCCRSSLQPARAGSRVTT